MKVSEVVRDSAQLVRVRRRLWFFGIFAGAAGVGAGGVRVDASDAGGLSELPPWVASMLGVAALVAVVLLAMNVLCDAALIREAHAPNSTLKSIASSLRQVWPRFWVLAGIKLAATAAMSATAVVAASPAVFALFGALSPTGAVALSVIFFVASLPWLLTLFFLYQYAMRYAVLREHGPLAALHHAKRALRGRIADSLQLTAWSLMGQLAGSLAAVAVALPGVLVAAALYSWVGPVVSVVCGALIAAPPAAAAVGAGGAFGSALWTLRFTSMEA